MLRFATVCLVMLSLSSCGILSPGLPAPKHEFRGVWIATVANIDWPKKGSDPWAKQQHDYIELLKFYRQLNFNTLIVQVRTAGDAFYPSQLAPWSRYITGVEGKAPATTEDPLSWMVETAHNWGFQFHAWFNPYRATINLDTTLLDENHDFNLHPEWMLRYGTKYYYNPGLPEVRAHLDSVIEEVVDRYDIDGVHFDDYFYPYKIGGEVLRDSAAYSQYAQPDQSIEDWRRSNVDSLVRRVHYTIKKHKPWLPFGISPFGVWRNRENDPKGSDTKAGQTTFDDLYADPLKWMQEGWIDYIVPQIYWSMDFPAASYSKLVAWWAENTKNTRLYVGNAAYKIRNNGDSTWMQKKELPRQLSLSRELKSVEGNVFFSAKSLPAHPDIVHDLKKKYYRYPALQPPYESGQTLPIKLPELQDILDKVNYYQINIAYDSPLTWNYALIYGAKRLKRLDTEEVPFLLQKSYIHSGRMLTLGKNLLRDKKYLALTFLDVYGNETPPIIIHLKENNSYGPKK